MAIKRSGRIAAVALGFLACALAPAHAGDDSDGKPSSDASSPAADQMQMAGPLTLNPNPASIQVGPLGRVDVAGIVSAYGLVQDATFPGDRPTRLDFSNLQVVLQKNDGALQFYVQTGLYATPALGLTNTSTIRADTQQFGFVPVAYAKAVVNDAFSISAGKLPSLITGESTFTFQNFNIERGLIFGQSNNVNRGFQADVKIDRTMISLSLNDGFYSGRLNWLIGSITQTIDDANSVAFSGGANLDRTRFQSYAAPLLQDNSSIYNAIYNFKSDRWMLSPYLQVTHVRRDAVLDIAESASTYGGAVLASYALTPQFALAGRLEYIAQTGNRYTGTTSLLYGPGSRALSATLTPTYQVDRFFVRGEYSLVKVVHATAGQAFGKNGTQTRQNRFAIESGVLF